MPYFEFEVFCSCGSGLCNQTDVKGLRLYVKPCEICMSQRYDDGYDKGYDKGHDTGYSDCQKDSST